MRLSIILLLIGSSWAEFLPNGCPRDPSVHRLLKHETDCTKFYSCSNGTPVLMSCGPGTAFDFDLQVCNWPHRIGNTTSTTLKPSTTTTKTIPTDPTTASMSSTTVTQELTTITAPTTTRTTATPDVTTIPPSPEECPYDVTLVLPEYLNCEEIKTCADYIKLKLNCPIHLKRNDYILYLEIKTGSMKRNKSTKLYAVPVNEEF